MANENYKSSPVGTFLTCVFAKPPKEILSDLERLSFGLEQALSEDKFKIEAGICKQYSWGLISSKLLSESHALVRTDVKKEIATFQLYSCRGEDDGEKTLDCLRNLLGDESQLSKGKIIVDPSMVKGKNSFSCAPKNPLEVVYSCVFLGISEEIIRDNACLKKILMNSLNRPMPREFEFVEKNFQPQGYSGLIYLPSRIFLAIHSYPESEYKALSTQLSYQLTNQGENNPVQSILNKLEKELGVKKTQFMAREIGLY